MQLTAPLKFLVVLIPIALASVACSKTDTEQSVNLAVAECRELASPEWNVVSGYDIQKRSAAWKACKTAVESQRADSELRFYYGRILHQLSNHTEAYKWYRAAADEGHVGAMSGVAYLYFNGQGVQQNSTEAVKWWRLSAEKGYVPAITSLGLAYAMGEGVPTDYAEALRLWRIAAERNSAMAIRNIGLLYLNGQGVERNASEAWMWFKRADELEPGIAQAQIQSLIDEERERTEVAQRREREQRAAYEQQVGRCVRTAQSSGYRSGACAFGFIQACLSGNTNEMDAHIATDRMLGMIGARNCPNMPTNYVDAFDRL